MSRTLVVLQSRLSSSRLPGKAMLSVAGRPMVVLAAQRAGNAGGATDVVVATSDQPEDDVIATAVTAAGIAVVRGPLDDPLARFGIAVAEASGGPLADDDVVVRLTADNVVPDGGLVAHLVDGLGQGGFDYVRLGGDDPALPYGVAGEAFTARVLREADATATSAHDREHVTPWIRQQVGDRPLQVADASPAWAGARCTVDTFDDFVRVAKVFASVDDPVGESWRSLSDRLVGDRAEPWPAHDANALGQGPLVLGTVQLGVPYGAANEAGMPSAETARAVLDTARRQGLTHLDTARAYGDSEKRVGAALARGLGEHVGVVTKVAPLDDVALDAPAAHGRDAVTASLQTSLRALQSSSVAALLLHRAADWSRPGVRDALVEARAAGTARMVGASLSTPAELVELLTDPELGYVQLPFNLLDRRWLADDVQAALADRRDVVVTARSAYLQGLLVADTARWPANAGLDPASVRSALDTLVTDLGRVSRADLCLAYVLGQPWVTSAVVGAETPEQVADSAALARRTPLSAAEIAHVHDVLPAGGNDLVDPSRWRQS